MSPPVRALVAALALLLAVVVLFTWVFPWAESRFVTDPVLHPSGQAS
jgi:hypothetical protein